jgi:outer membrane lipoprotein-sorting protein
VPSRLKIGLIAAALLVFPPVARAELTLDQLMQHITETESSIQDIRFRYVLHAREGQFQGRTSGELMLKKPSQLRIAQSKPEKLTILTDGAKLWLYSARQQQVLIGDWARWVQASKFPLTLMNVIGAFGAGSWKQRYQGYFEGHEDGQYKVRFVNNIPDAEPPVVIWFSDKTFLPQRGDLFARGYTAQVRLSEIRTNQAVPDSFFRPQFPAGTVEVPVSF